MIASPADTDGADSRTTQNKPRPKSRSSSIARRFTRTSQNPDDDSDCGTSANSASKANSAGRVDGVDLRPSRGRSALRPARATALDGDSPGDMADDDYTHGPLDDELL